MGHFYLTKLLIERLQQGKKYLSNCEYEAAPSRVVAVSSEGHNFAAQPNMVEWSSGKSYERYFGAWVAYGNSKLSNVLFAREVNL